MVGTDGEIEEELPTSGGTMHGCCSEGRYVHTHECRTCGESIWCEQSDEECDRNGGIGQYNGQCDECNMREYRAARINAKLAHLRSDDAYYD